jgi:hypothetical protein
MTSRPDIQVKALAEGLPYQTLIASILHKYVTGRLEKRKPGSPPAVPKATAATRRSARRDA